MVRLIRVDPPLIDAALAGDDVLAEALGHEVVPGWATFAQALASVRDQLVDDPRAGEWGPRFFIAEEPPALVGWGGFKGPPAAGVVEIGYEIAESHWNRGLASAASRAMVAEAFADDEVATVIAHTLAEPNASNRVLQKLGFRHAGEEVEGGEVVWRYVLDRPTASGG